MGAPMGGRYNIARRFCEDLEWDRQLAGHAPSSGLRRGVDPGIPQARDVLSSFNGLGLDADGTVSVPPYQGCKIVYRE